VYVQVGSVYSSEFYNAAQAGLRPNMRFWISHRVDYEGETHLIYEGQTYHVIRTDWDGDGVALICEEQVKEFDSWSE
jgi:SPP1 family predicted phage head-tail adaptor